jgi:hypothetical protein
MPYTLSTLETARERDMFFVSVNSMLPIGSLRASYDHAAAFHLHSQLRYIAKPSGVVVCTFDYY